MKKNIIIAIAGMMLFVFTQCDRGSKEFKETKELYKRIEAIVDNATTCDELQEAELILVSELSANNYTEEEKMTESENARLEKTIKTINEKIEMQLDRLGCN